MVRLAHFSDVHLTSPRLGWRVRDVFGKRASGWVNVKILGRGKRFRNANAVVESLLREFRERHQRTREFFLHRFEQVRKYLLTDRPLSESQRLLIGSYFTSEYALESAALFNPSMVWHPDQSGLPEGTSRFILSLRATGEGHISSITFRSGAIDAENQIHIDEPTRFVVAPELVPNALYEKALFYRKLSELEINGVFTELVMSAQEGQGFQTPEAMKARTLARKTPALPGFVPGNPGFAIATT